MACPYFMPTRKSEQGEWLHPARLPLGAGWEGVCMASGHEGSAPEQAQLREGCNLGYAAGCPKLPAQRDWDAIRFAVSREHESRVWLAYVCEKDYLPVEHGLLEFDIPAKTWIQPHRDARVQRLAACFLDCRRSREASTEPPGGGTGDRQ
jgi:hypothetical protein